MIAALVDFFRKLWNVAVEQHRHMLHTKPSFYLLLIGVPLAYVLVLGYCYSPSVVNDIPTGIYDGDNTHVSRQYRQLYVDSQKFQVVEYVNTEGELLEDLEKGRIRVGIAIPEHFARDIKTGVQTHVGIYMNGENGSFANSAIASETTINRTFQVKLLQTLMQKIGKMEASVEGHAYPVEVRARVLNNPVGGYSYFMTSSILLHGIQIALMLTVGPFMVHECKNLDFDESYPALSIILGKMLPCYLPVLLAWYLGLFLMHVLFAVPVRGSLLEMGALVLAMSFFVCGILMGIASFCPNEALALQAPLVYVMPSLQYCGINWPDELMLPFVDFYSSIEPLRYAAEPMRELVVEGYTPHLGFNITCSLIGGVVGITLACIMVSLRRRYGFRKRREAEAHA